MAPALMPIKKAFIFPLEFASKSRATVCHSRDCAQNPALGSVDAGFTGSDWLSGYHYFYSPVLLPACCGAI
jgi:hypothetical protein